MKLSRFFPLVLAVRVITSTLQGALHEEHFDREPANWNGFNHRNKFFQPRAVLQDFGFNPSSNQAGVAPGEIGGRINPAGESAFYGYRLPAPLTFDSGMEATGSILLPPGAGHFLLGFFNADTASGWRTPNTLVARFNNRGETFHCHVEYCSGKWRASAGVIGEILPNDRLRQIENPSGKRYRWQLNYDPKGGGGKGVLTFTLNDHKATCEITPEHRIDGVRLTHFGLLPVLKTWDSAGDVWIDDVTVNGRHFDFSVDPSWEGKNNRRSYITTDTRPKFDFGWSDTQYAGGARRGELGGLIFRGDCRESARMAWYGDPLEPISLRKVLEARGRVSVLRAISDSTASIGFFNSKTSTQTNNSQSCSIPKDYLGINIEGPSSEGFYFYPVYRLSNGEYAVPDVRKSPRILPDGKQHDWSLRYEPGTDSGSGSITVTLDDQHFTMEMKRAHRMSGANFDRFGICTPWIDGNSVLVYFDDLFYTASQ
jgi:hypothetical protein